MFYDFYKKRKKDKIWWTDEVGKTGSPYFSFDKKEIFCLFKDYPSKLTHEQKAIFDAENPFWARFFLNDPPKMVHRSTK